MEPHKNKSLSQNQVPPFELAPSSNVRLEYYEEVVKDAEKRMRKLNSSPGISKKRLKKQEVERDDIISQMMYGLRGSMEEQFRRLKRSEKVLKDFKNEFSKLKEKEKQAMENARLARELKDQETDRLVPSLLRDTPCEPNLSLPSQK